MSKQLTRRRLLASVGGLAGLALGGTAGAVPSRADSADELPVRWNRTYAPNSVNSAVTALERDDQYVALGGTGSQVGETTGWLFGIDATTGEGQWQTRLENPDLDSQPGFSAAVPAVDGDGLALLGSDPLSGQVSLVRTTGEGEIDWWETYESAESEEVTAAFQSLVALSDGYVIGGYRTQEQEFDAATIRVDADGAEQSRNTFFEEQTATILSLTSDGDGGYVGVGELQEPTDSGSEDQPPIRANLFRADADGTVQWQRDFTAPTDETLFINQFGDLAGTEDGYAAAGLAADQTVSNIRGWVVRTDESGQGQASRLLEPRATTALTGVTEASDGLTVVGQVSESSNLQGGSGWVAELDDGNAPRWSRELSAMAAGGFEHVLATSDDGVALVGAAQADSQGADPQTQAWVVKLGGEPAPSVTSTPADDTATPTSSPTPTTAPTPTETPEPTPTPTPTATLTDVATETPTDAGTTSGTGPGFGAVGALAALGAGALYRRVTDDAEE